MTLNDELYQQCPRMLYWQSPDARYLMNMFYNCRKQNIFPFPGSVAEQTHFTAELFDYIDQLNHATQEKQASKNRKPEA